MSNSNRRQKSNFRKNSGSSSKTQNKQTREKFESEMEGKGNNKFREKDNRGNTSGANSTDWYGGSSILMQNAANVSFHSGVGKPLSLSTGCGSDVMFNPAGIMVFSSLNVPGAAADWNAPINLASRHIYTYVRHVNSGHSNYDAVDLMMYLTLMDNAYSYYAWMVRAYGAAHAVLLRNRFTPKGVVEAMGIDYDKLIQNMADFRFYINLFATRLNQMAVPNNMPIFQRHMWMYSNVYADAPSDKAQFYLFKPHSFWKYTVTDTERYLEPSYRIADADGSPWTIQMVCGVGDQILNQVLQREDFNIMSGDILKAYGQNLLKVNPIAEDYTVTPVYDPEILLQIHNANVLDHFGTLASTGDAFLDRSWRIKEVIYDNADAGALKFMPYMKTQPAAFAYIQDQILDMPMESPTPANIAAATRFMHSTNGVVTIQGDNDADEGTDYSGIVNFGSELLVNTYILFTNSETGEVYGVKQQFAAVGYTHCVDVQHFEMRPFMIRLDDTSSEAAGTRYALKQIYGDLTNYTKMDKSSLQNIHEAAALALYGIA